MSEDIYNFEHLADNERTLIVRLNSQVLGGNDALNFNAGLNSIDKTEIKFLIIDLTEVTLMNSSGLGMLVNAHTQLKNYKIKVYLLNAKPKIRQLLEMTHLNQVLEMFDSIEVALSKCI